MYRHRSKRNVLELLTSSANNAHQAASTKIEELHKPHRFLKLSEKELARLQTLGNATSAQLERAEIKLQDADKMRKLTKEMNKAVVRQLIRNREAAEKYLKEIKGLDAEKKKEDDDTKIYEQLMLEVVNVFLNPGK